MTKEFEIKKLVGNKGFFCRITYDITIYDNPMQVLECSVDDKWYSSVLFGGAYFFEKYSKSTGRGFRFKVHGIEGQIVDTTTMVVFYSVVSLLSKETSFSIEEFYLNEQGQVVLPK